MERKNKRGKRIGPYSVCVYFLDGTSLIVREQTDDEEANQAFKEHSRGIWGDGGQPLVESLSPMKRTTRCVVGNTEWRQSE